MIENETQNATASIGQSSIEQPLQTWVAPSFERIPLNEAMNSLPPVPGGDGATTYS